MNVMPEYEVIVHRREIYWLISHLRFLQQLEI